MKATGRLIDADALIKKHPKVCSLDMKFNLALAPTIDAAPVVHGEWLDFFRDFSTAECSKCGEVYEVSPEEKPKEEYFNAFQQCYKFCPSCGAHMDTGENGPTT